ncbi:1-acyl-sn-glycerol-3-phosphate acyltransferase [Oscillatoria sp. CS-180]|uniref:lysophospholipid acyltransferase family protein n=1 Tax=Oscillatoria sp. CS-180 TaxID=3021720 RepID=UPI00232DB57A|nr:1-acyl-sn-glycerol-3-phosphate acyltransferase [Oscillatoria sp. CS-180]MDB9524467.1 1-acyl-sn-glycerol-3-phosphate acyltransferase [Oscillatoria sp. CS-180]
MPTASPSSVPLKRVSTTVSKCSPWLTPLAYFLGEKFVVPSYFRKIHIYGQENLPTSGPLILAPTHRARWDSIVIPYVAGRSVTGRDLHFMVTSDEVQGVQGWFIRRLGGFAVNVRSPSISSLRHGIELLQEEHPLVIYPEGNIFRDNQVHRLKPGLARIALQAEAQTHELGVKILPVSIQYEDPTPNWRNDVKITFGQPLDTASYLPSHQSHLLTAEELKTAARRLTDDLAAQMNALSDVQRLPQ